MSVNRYNTFLSIGDGQAVFVRYLCTFLGKKGAARWKMLVTKE